MSAPLASNDPIERIAWQFSPLLVDGPDRAWRPDPARVFTAERTWPAEVGRGEAWGMCLAYSRRMGWNEGAWRKCHTPTHWAWYYVGDGA